MFIFFEFIELMFLIFSHNWRKDMTKRNSSLDFIFLLVNTMMTRRKWWKILIGTWRKEEIFWERTRWYTLFICQKKMNGTKLDRDKSDKTFSSSSSSYGWFPLTLFIQICLRCCSSSKISIFKTMFSLQEWSSGT